MSENSAENSQELPEYLRNPTAPDSPVLLADAIRNARVARVVASLTDGQLLSDTNLADFLTENLNNLEFLALLEAEVLEHTAKIGVLAERSLQVQAVQSAANGYWNYHPEKPGTFRDYIANRLQEISRNSGLHYELSFLAEVYAPWARQHQQPFEELWQGDNLSKLRLLASGVGSDFREAGINGQDDADKSLPQTAQEKLGRLIEKATDPKVAVAEMRQHVQQGKPDIGTITAYEYITPGRGVIVFDCDENQAKYLKRVLGERIEWKIGTGHEEVISTITPKKR